MKLYYSNTKANLLILAFISLIGCSASTTTEITGKSKGSNSEVAIEPDSVRGSFTFSTETDASDSTNWFYQLYGSLFPDDSIPRKHPVSGGTVTINNYALSPVSKGSNNYGYYGVIQSASPVSNTNAGTTGSWGISGDSTNNLPSFSTNFYAPKRIRLISPTKNSTVSKSNGFQITWNTDGNNPSGVVYIVVKYSSAFSRASDTAMPDSDILSYNTVTDNGSYSFQSSQLSSMPVGGVTIVTVYRENNSTYLSGSKKFRLRASSISETLVIMGD